MFVQISCIVEGHGEVEAVPILIRRIAAILYPDMVVRIHLPIRISRSKIVKPGELERMVELAARKTGGRGAVFILLDSDDDCPAQMGPELLDRALMVRSDLPIAVTLAKCEFEAWFLAAAESIGGRRGLSKNLKSPLKPENIRDAKGWLSYRMEGSRTYRETLDQAALAAALDFDSARVADSFDKCYRDITYLLTQLRNTAFS